MGGKRPLGLDLGSLALPFLAVFAILAFAPVVELLSWRFVTLWHEVHAALRAGQLPLWQHALGGGSPLLGAFRFGALYPGLSLFALLPFGWAAAIFFGLHLWFGGEGLRRWGLAQGLAAAKARGAALIAQALLCLGALWLQPADLAALAWLAWALLLLNSARAGLAFLALSMVVLAGQPLLALAPLALFWALGQPLARASRRVALACLLVAPVLLPSLENAFFARLNPGRVEAGPWSLLHAARPQAGQAQMLVAQVRQSRMALSARAVSAASSLLPLAAQGARFVESPDLFVVGPLPALAARLRGLNADAGNLRSALEVALTLDGPTAAGGTERWPSPIRAALVTGAQARLQLQNPLAAMTERLFERSLILEDAPKGLTRSVGGAWTLLSAQLLPNGLDVTLPEGHAGGWVFASLNAVPGWTARTEQGRLPVYRAEEAFVAAYAPKGAPQLHFRYVGRSFLAGCLLSALTLLWLGIQKRRERPF